MLSDDEIEGIKTRLEIFSESALFRPDVCSVSAMLADREVFQLALALACKHIYFLNHEFSIPHTYQDEDVSSYLILAQAFIDSQKEASE